MDKVREFDKGLKSINQNANFMAKVMIYLMCGFGFMFLLFPVGKTYDGGDFWFVAAYEGFFFGTAEWYYLVNYQRIQEGNRQISVYKKLRYMPVTKAQIRKVRCGYSDRFCCKIGIAAFVIQETASLINHSFGLLSILAVLLLAVTIWVFGRICIWFSLT